MADPRETLRRSWIPLPVRAWDKRGGEGDNRRGEWGEKWVREGMGEVGEGKREVAIWMEMRIRER
jgi:hypothetical protein